MDERSHLNLLDVLKSDTSVDLALDDGLADVHTAPYGGVVARRHSIVLRQLVDLDL
jgi:hypothetical protein